jgi:hypothetical protein
MPPSSAKMLIVVLCPGRNVCFDTESTSDRPHSGVSSKASLLTLTTCLIGGGSSMIRMIVCDSKSHT